MTHTLPSTLNSSSSISSSKYIKNRLINPSQSRQRSMSLSTIVLHYSKSSSLHHRRSSISQQTPSRRRAYSDERLFSSSDNDINNCFSNYQRDDSMVEFGCSLAMDISTGFG